MLPIPRKCQDLKKCTTRPKTRNSQSIMNPVPGKYLDERNEKPEMDHLRSIQSPERLRSRCVCAAVENSLVAN